MHGYDLCLLWLGSRQVPCMRQADEGCDAQEQTNDRCKEVLPWSCHVRLLTLMLGDPQIFQEKSKLAFSSVGN